MIDFEAIDKNVNNDVEDEIDAVLKVILEIDFDVWAVFDVEDNATSN